MVSLVVRNDATIEHLIHENPAIREGKLLSGSYQILNVPEADVPEVMQALGNTKIDAYSLVVGLLGKEALDASGITPILQQPYLDLKGRGVLLGFVDTGIDYTKDDFRYENNTSKIQFIWDQTLEGDSPDGYGFGAEFGNSRINQALQSSNPYEIVPHRDTAGHGTFLASVAGSRKPGEGAAPAAEIIAVKLRKTSGFYTDVFLIPKDQENAFDSADVMQGIEYILDKAFALNRPVAICISVGTNLGGHDGFSVFEEYLSRISHRTGVTLCAAAGNEGNAAHHTSGVIAQAGDIRKIEVNVGQNAGGVYLHILSDAEDRISVAVTSPTGEMVGRIPAKNGSVTTEHLVLEKATVEVYYFFPIEGSGAQLTTVKILDATPGLWTILAHGDIVVSGKYNAWLPLTGFISPGVSFLSPTPECTVVVPASAVGVITCGAFRSLEKSLYAASSWGPTRLPFSSPDLSAPGVQVTGTFPIGSGEMSGTSVAAAVTTGACALLLQWGIVDKNEIYVDTYLARAYLIRGCDRDTGLEYPNDQWGYGRLNLQNTFNLLRRT